MHKLLCIVLIIALLAVMVQAFSGCDIVGKGDTVYITKTGSKFHRAGCRYLRESKIAIDRDEAIALGYTPCSVCKP